MAKANLPAVLDEERAVSTLDEMINDLEDDGLGEIGVTFPEIKLIQGTTRNVPESNRHIGDFYHPDTGEFVSTLEVVPVYMQTQRALFEDGVEAPGCASPDNIAPFPNQPIWDKPVALIKGKEYPHEFYAQPRLCAECPYYQFGENGTPPECGESILMMVQREDESLAKYRVNRSGLGPVRNAARRLQVKGKRLPAYSALWSLRSETKESTGRKWEQLKVSTTMLPPERVLAISALARQMRTDMQKEASTVDLGAEATGVVIDGDFEEPGYGDE